MNHRDNLITDSFVLPDGRTGQIESGSAFKNFWHYSGFGGSGYLVTVDGEKVAQVAFRFDAIRAARGLGATVTDSMAPTAWDTEKSAPRSPA
jgi:hypothetical protein